MSDCVGAPRMPVCRENYPFVCSTIKSPDNVPIKFSIENGASVRIVFLNYQSQKHKHKRSRSRQYVFTALLDNVRDHRVRTIICKQKNAHASRTSRASHCYLAASVDVSTPQWSSFDTMPFMSVEIRMRDASFFLFGSSVLIKYQWVCPV